MNKPFQWTKSRARLHCVRSVEGASYNWLFLPGGPGLGSESLVGLTDILNLPGTTWLIDLPGDGSNTTSDDAGHFARWSEALVEATTALSNVILVAHSSGGMFALATPALKNILHGLVLMDSAPDSSWQAHFGLYVQAHPLPDSQALQKEYDEHPSNEALKRLTIACAPYFLTDAGMATSISLFTSLPYNHVTVDWAAKNFDQTYKALWVPDNMPVLIFAGDEDHITPLALFRHAREFQHENIVIREIQHAAHFPWIDNAEMIRQLFAEYAERLKHFTRN